MSKFDLPEIESFEQFTTESSMLTLNEWALLETFETSYNLDFFQRL